MNSMLPILGVVRIVGVATIALLHSAHGEPVPPLSVVGQASYSVGWIKVYDASLRAPGGQFDWGAPFELSLTYALGISRDQLVETTLSEMANNMDAPKASFSHLRSGLETCFADVRRGDRFVAIREADDKIRFLLNDNLTCLWQEPRISRTFFSIWLGDDTRSPRLSKKLRGLR